MIFRTNKFDHPAVITSRWRECDIWNKKIVISCANSQGKLNAKSAAFPPRRSAINLPAMFIDDPLGICETEAGAIALRGEEWDEKISSFFLGHATTVIADRYQGPRTIPLGADRQVSSIRHRIQCITDQV
jgi:hypothetical protein